PHPSYGNQLNEEGVPGVPGEGRAILRWQEKTTTLADGTSIRLGSPSVEFAELAYGRMDATVMTSPRVGPPVYGLGLLEAVPLSTLQKIAAEQSRYGVRGSFNQVWDEAQQKFVPGRFGWKANSPNLRQQIAEAFIGDLGVTTPLFPQTQCAETQSDCRNAAKAEHQPELSAERLVDIDFYTAHLAPPPRRNTADPAVRRGEQWFSEAGCAVCHIPKLKTAPHPRFPNRLPAQNIEPYTDLLLHDMGSGLSDGRPDFSASGSQWRTPPLWGIGLVPIVNGHSQYLHDGRARNLEEAIVWHDGEALAARTRYGELSLDQRRELLAFLQSL
ncbi:MAG: di-heme oxidoredictase family protein, partial [Methylomonas sp.]|nr:di-heme oxidoredictase family protein [Methylomonas sp.]